jgi:hypothetical protein
MGWAEGLNAGINLGNVIKQGMLQQDLADEAKKYKVTEGAYGTGLSENLQHVIGARDQALQGLGENATPEQIQQVHEQYTPAMAELSRRVGLSAPDYSVNSGTQNYADRQAAEYAASQARTAGLADVYRSHGQVDKAEELTARAQQQQLTGLQLSKAKREDEADTRYANFGQFAAQNPDMTAAQLKEAAQSQFKFTPEQWEKAVTTRLNIEKADLDMFKANVSKKMQGKSLAQLGSLYNTDPDFDDKTDLAIVPGKGGAVTLNFVDKATNKVTGSQSFANEALAVEYLHTQAKQPEVMGSWLLGVQTKEQQIAASKASVTASNASAGLSTERLNSLKDERENRGKAADIAAEYEDLTDIEKAGPKGQGLIRRFNLANAKAGTQISLGAQPRAGQTMTDVEKANLTEYYKWAHDDRNARLPQAEKDKKATSMGVYNFVNPSANVVQSGLGSNPYANTGGKAEQGSGNQQGIQTAPPKLTSMNTRLLGRAGNMGYNVELPDGTTRIMEKDELEDLGYRFPAPR